MADGGTWQKTEILPYKAAITPYGAAMASLPSQIAYDSWQQIHHAIPPWRLFNNTSKDNHISSNFALMEHNGHYFCADEHT